MTTKETIAQWRQDGTLPCTSAGLDDGVVYQFSGNLMICRHNDDGEAVLNDWSPDTDITLWHGDDGLLAEIERQELIARFMLAMREVVGITTWAHMTATPAQLAAALVKVIEEGE